MRRNDDRIVDKSVGRLRNPRLPRCTGSKSDTRMPPSTTIERHKLHQASLLIPICTILMQNNNENKSIGTSASKSIKSLSLALECIDDIHGGDSLATGMLRVRNRITNHILQKHLENSTRFFVNETGDALDTTTTSQAPNGRLCNTLNIVTKDLAMTLGATLSKSLSSFSTAYRIREKGEATNLSVTKHKRYLSCCPP